MILLANLPSASPTTSIINLNIFPSPFTLPDYNSVWLINFIKFHLMNKQDISLYKQHDVIKIDTDFVSDDVMHQNYVIT